MHDFKMSEPVSAKLAIPIFLFKNRETLIKLSRISLVLIPVFLIFEQIYIIYINQTYPYVLGYLFHSILITLLVTFWCFIIVWRYYHPIAQISGFILMYWLMLPLTNYISNATISIAYSPISFGLNVFMVLLVLLNLITFIVQFIYCAVRRFKDIRGKVTIAHHVFFIFFLLIGLLFLSANGFFQKERVVPTHPVSPSEFKISFFTESNFTDLSSESINGMRELNGQQYLMIPRDILT